VRVIPATPALLDAVDTLLIPGRGVARIPHLAMFLPEVARVVPGSALTKSTTGDDRCAVAGWGHKPTARKARALAANRGLPYVALEDGFLRSVGLGEAGAPPLSLVVDDLGIYYDARQPSRLETLIERGEGLDDDALIARAQAAMARIIALDLAKTNSAPRADLSGLATDGRPILLLVDQTDGDESIAGGLASRDSFLAMVDTARRDRPDHHIVVRRHPAVAAGLKRGCIPADALHGLTLLDQHVASPSILQQVDELWCVTSLMGFEALIRGISVRCFGMPFYAGWGVTQDELTCPRRTARRSVAAIFAAAYLLYSRYIDPFSGRPTTLELTIDRLAHWRDVAEANAGHIAATGFRPWKRAATRNLLASPNGTVSFHPTVADAARRADAVHGRVLVWSGKEDDRMRSALDALTVPVVRMEDGFLRSRGLGSDFHLPASVVTDDVGIYFDRSRPSRLEVILQTAAMDAALLDRAAALRGRLVAAGLSKYNVGNRVTLSPPAGRFCLLVVGQVEDDRSIQRGTGDVASNLALLRAARADHPDAWIVYKPHPDVESGNRKGIVPPESLDMLADHVARDADIATCLHACDGLATMTSLAGFEALLRDKPVWTYGMPFYAGWGLTHDQMTCDRRTRRLSLDMLVAGTLLLYPRYVHPPTGLPCTAEALVDWLEQTPAGTGPRRSRWLRALIETVRQRPPAQY
jgi:capsular polysaccharide export protein